MELDRANVGKERNLVRVVMVQQVLLVGLLASAYFTWTESARNSQLVNDRFDLLQDDRNSLVSRLTAVEAERDALHGRFDALHSRIDTIGGQHQQSLLAQQSFLAQSANGGLTPARRLADAATATATDSRATVQIDAPDGVSEIILGGKTAGDNVVMTKAHLSDGADFSLRRNETDVLSISAAGTLTAHTGVSSAGGEQLELRSSTGDGVVLQDQQTTLVTEVDGTATWSKDSLLVYTGDTVVWSWTNYHNVIEINAAGVIVSGGIQSGAAEVSATFSHTFTQPGTYLFKSQVADDMRITVEVREFAVRNGTMVVGGDLEVKGSLSEGMAGPGFEQEVKMFLGSACPTGWTEATELGGYFLMGRAPGGEVNVTKNRKMDAGEDGRMHSTYYKGNADISATLDSAYDDRYFGGYYSYANGQSYATTSYDCTSPSDCNYCSLPDGGFVDCETHFGRYSHLDYFTHYTNYAYNSVARWDKLRNSAYQTSEYMGPIGEYYPFASVLLCKRA
jgi:plastocyanin